ncbi:MAG: hypothetical protein Alpg2KO_13450 [Alphaproteobacteria bacterium]
MIEAIGVSLQAVRAPVQVVERSEVPPPQEVKTQPESKDLSQVQYYSPVITLDVDTQSTILQYRDGMTGEVTREYGRGSQPPETPAAADKGLADEGPAQVSGNGYPADALAGEGIAPASPDAQAAAPAPEQSRSNDRAEAQATPPREKLDLAV